MGPTSGTRSDDMLWRRLRVFVVHVNSVVAAFDPKLPLEFVSYGSTSSALYIVPCATGIGTFAPSMMKCSSSERRIK